MTSTPKKTSPRPSHKQTSSKSPVSNASFSSGTGDEDELDSSHPSSNLSHNTSGLTGSQSPDKTGTSSIDAEIPELTLTRRPLRSNKAGLSPSVVNRKVTKTPGKSDPMGGSPQRTSFSLSNSSAEDSPDQPYNDPHVSTGEKCKSDQPMREIQTQKVTDRKLEDTRGGSSTHTQSQKKPRRIICYSVSVVVLIGLIILYLLQSPYSEPDLSNVDAEHPNIELTRFVVRLQKLKAKFPAQNSYLWRTVSAATKRIIHDPVPIQPAVILIGSSKSTRNEADCLARHISEVVTAAYKAGDSIRIDVPVDYGRRTPEDAKIALEHSLLSGFRAGAARSAVISGLEEMHGDTAMLLHAFCDNDNAPFTKVVILFTLHVDDPDLTGAKRDTRRVEDHLSTIWQRHLDYNDVYALLSRVANNIVVVTKESDDVMKEHC